MLCRKYGETEQEIGILEQRLLLRKKENEVCLLLPEKFSPVFKIFVGFRPRDFENIML